MLRFCDICHWYALLFLYDLRKVRIDFTLNAYWKWRSLLSIALHFDQKVEFAPCFSDNEEYFYPSVGFEEPKTSGICDLCIQLIPDWFGNLYQFALVLLSKTNAFNRDTYSKLNSGCLFALPLILSITMHSFLRSMWLKWVIIRETENSVSTIEFYRLFLTKSNGLCWDICWKLRK